MASGATPVDVASFLGGLLHRIARQPCAARSREPEDSTALEAKLEKSLTMELVRNSGSLYATLPKGQVVEGTVTETRFAE